MSLLDELPAAAARVVGAAGRAVVRIGREGRGSGIVVAPGQVLTSAHNIRGEETTVTFEGGRSVIGTVKGLDADGDLAIVEVDTGDATAAGWSDAEPQLGSAVFALALAPDAGTRVTFGTVSGTGRAFRGPRGRLITDGIEHTAPLGRGSSGGPLVDTEGRLVGINTHRPGDGFYLAIPATSALRERVEALGRGESPKRRHLGVALAPPRVARRLRSAVGLEPRDGVLVREVSEGSPAAAAGVMRGDLIVAAAGSDVTSIDSLLAAVDAVGEGGTLQLRVLRGAAEVEVSVQF